MILYSRKEFARKQSQPHPSTDHTRKCFFENRAPKMALLGVVGWGHMDLKITKNILPAASKSTKLLRIRHVHTHLRIYM